MDLLTIGIPVAFVAALAVGFGLIYRHTARQNAERAALCAARGWTLVPSPGRDVLWRVDGRTADGAPWTVQKLQTRSKGLSGSGWSTPAGAVDGAVLLGPVTLGVGSVPLGSPLVQYMLRAVLGDGAAALADARPVEVGSPAFRKLYSVLATDRDLAREVLSGPAEMALLDWAEHRPRNRHPVLFFWREGLSVRLGEGLDRPQELAALVELSELILAAR